MNYDLFLLNYLKKISTEGGVRVENTKCAGKQTGRYE